MSKPLPIPETPLIILRNSILSVKEQRKYPTTTNKHPNKADFLRLSLDTKDPKKIALIAIAISSIETTKPIDCLLKLKPSSRVPTVKGNNVAGEFPITSKLIPPTITRNEVFSLFTYSQEYIYRQVTPIHLRVKPLLVIQRHENI